MTFKVDLFEVAAGARRAIAESDGAWDGEARAICVELSRQIKAAGGPDGSLEEQLRIFLAAYRTKTALPCPGDVRIKLDMREVARAGIHGVEGVAIVVDAIYDALVVAGAPAVSTESTEEPLMVLLSALLASHRAMAEAGEEMPSKDAFLAALWKTPGHPSVEGAEAAIEILRPIIARLQRERNELAARLDAGQFTVNVDIAEAKAKLEEVASMAERYEATLDRALAKTQALASCSDPPSIGIGDPPPKPPPPPPPSVAEPADRECDMGGSCVWVDGRCDRCLRAIADRFFDREAYHETKRAVSNALDNMSYNRNTDGVRAAREAVDEWAAGQ